MESLVGNRIQQAGAVCIMAIDRHGGNADPFRDGAHRYGRKTFSVKKLARGHDD
jgi:hypothetical protein